MNGLWIGGGTGTSVSSTSSSWARACLSSSSACLRRASSASARRRSFSFCRKRASSSPSRATRRFTVKFSGPPVSFLRTASPREPGSGRAVNITVLRLFSAHLMNSSAEGPYSRLGAVASTTQGWVSCSTSAMLWHSRTHLHTILGGGGGGGEIV